MIASVFLASAALPLSGPTSRESLVAWAAVTGVGFSAGFLLDHLDLSRIMPPVTSGRSG